MTNRPKLEREMMYCPNCGEKLDSQNQKYCSTCGSDLTYTPEPPQLRAEDDQMSSPVRSIPVYESKPIKEGDPGPISRKCLIFAIGSIALTIVGFIFGGINLIRFIMPLSLFPYYYGGLGVWIIAIVLHIIGLILGILSRVNSQKADELEPINILVKIGSVISVFGIIMNAIPIVIIPIIIGFFFVI